MIKEIRLGDNEWDEIVMTFPDYDVYQLSGYVKAFSGGTQGEAILLYYKNGSERGVNVVMKRDISEADAFKNLLEKDTFYDLATPYGYGGWIFEGAEDSEAFNKEYLSWCEDNQVVSEFVRFHPMQQNAFGINQKIYNPVFLGHTVAIELDTEEGIWTRFSSKNRGHIRKAIKSGVEVRTSNEVSDYNEFKKIYNSTMDHDNAGDFYYFDDAFYRSIREDLKDNSLLFTAYLDGEAIASSIMIFANGFMNYHLSGQIFEKRKYAATNLLLFEAAKWGLKHGMKTLHLGGGVGAQAGPLYEFKKSFYAKGEDQDFYIGKKILSQEKYKYLCELRGFGSVADNGFFPAYRR